MKWLVRSTVALALLAGLGALIYLSTLEPPQVEDVPIPEVVQKAKKKRTPVGFRERPKRGGYYAGRVVDVNRKPIDSAHVLLIAYNPGDREAMRRYAEALKSDAARPDPALIPRIGDYRLAAEKITDKNGTFRISAGQAFYITQIVAYRTGYFPTIEDVQIYKVERGGAREGIEIVLEEAGRLKGTVVDDETGKPVPNAIVDINLQNPTRPPPDIPEGQEVGTRSQTGTPVPLSQFSLLQNFIAEHLGDRVWGIPFEGTNSLRLYSDRQGRFELGPLGNTVQLEFIVTHPEYKWSDYDNPTGKTAPRRTVVDPGQTVHKELRLKRGAEIQGQVIISETGEPVVGAVVEAKSISAYFRHWWYRHRSRKTKTDAEGKFTIKGLSVGTQNLIVKHASFGTKYKHGVEADEKKVLIYVEPFAGLVGRVVGLSQRPPGGRVEVNFEAPEPNPKRARLTQRRVVLQPGDRFVVERMPPGMYRVWVRAGNMNSQPQDLELETLRSVAADFVLGGGGALQTSFYAQKVPAVDPVSVNLIRIGEEGERDMGLIVSREGAIDVEGLVPGRYRLRARAMGYMPKVVPAFDIPEDRVVKLPPIELLALASIEFRTILDENGRPMGANRGTVVLEVEPKGQAVRRIHTTNIPVELAPGEVTVRARVEKAGLSFEKTFQLPGGQVTPVVVKLRKD